MLTSRSINSYMRSPRRVTMAPMGMPARTLKAAIDFLALVITGFCPVMWPRSLASGSSIFEFCVASPTPMLTTILCSRGTAMGFVNPSSFASAGAISLLNFSFNRAVVFCPAMILSFLSHGFGGETGSWGIQFPVAETWHVASLRDHLSSGPSHLRQIRTRRLPCCLCPMRDGPQLGHTIITFEIEMGDSCSAIPPLMLRCGFGRTFFFTIITCSTSTLPSPGNTRSTRPCLPLSRPVITFTWSLRLMSTLVCIVSLQQSCSLQHLGSERNDLQELLLA